MGIVWEAFSGMKCCITPKCVCVSVCVSVRVRVPVLVCRVGHLNGLKGLLEAVWMLWCGNKTHTKRLGCLMSVYRLFLSVSDSGLVAIKSSTQGLVPLLHL